MKPKRMGGSCDTHGGGEEVYTGFWWGHIKDRCHLEDLGIDGMIILKWILNTWDREA